MKIAYIVIMAVLFVGYNIYNEKINGGGTFNFGGIIQAFISVILYLISWVIWFIIF